MSGNDPADAAKFMTELAAGMVQLHEMYRTAVDAGFTEDQAMQILLQTICSVMNK